MTDVDRALAQVQETHDALLAARRDNEKAQHRRDQAIRRAHAAGASYRRIAELLHVHHNYIYEVCTKE